MPVTSYSRTPASNNSAPPNGAPEGQTPGSVNNVIRQIMTDVVNEAGKGSAKVLGTVAGTNTITAGMSPALDAYTAGMIVVFTPANSNTGAVTINIDSLGALDVFKNSEQALGAGDLTSGVPAVMVLDAGADDFVLLNPTQSGSFTGTLTGMTSATTGTVSYRLVNGICTLYLAASIVGTSNSASMTMTGLPAAVTPTSSRGVNCTDISDASNSNMQGGGIVNTGGVIIFNLYNTSTVSNRVVRDPSVFTASGTKGLINQWQISYPI